MTARIQGLSCLLRPGLGLSSFIVLHIFISTFVSLIVLHTFSSLYCIISLSLYSFSYNGVYADQFSNFLQLHLDIQDLMDAHSESLEKHPFVSLNTNKCVRAWKLLWVLWIELIEGNTLHCAKETKNKTKRVQWRLLFHIYFCFTFWYMVLFHFSKELKWIVTIV